MGSKYSKSNNEEMKIEPQYWGTDTYKTQNKYNNYAWEAYSTSQQTQDNTESSMISTNNETKKNNTKEELCPFKFEWKGLGTTVILAGSFLENWTKFEPMIKNAETEIFEKIIYLTKTKHYFKFIVDNKWVCSNQYPTTMDKSNNQNNFIDLTNYNPPKDLVKVNEYKKGLIKHHRSKVIVIEKNDKKDKKDYNCKYPNIHELNTNAPSSITHYKYSFNIDYQSRQNTIENIGPKLNLKYSDKNTLTENNTYKKILTCPHEKLMHFCQNINDLNSKKRYTRGCTTIRNKHKFLTIVYYKPKYKYETINFD